MNRQERPRPENFTPKMQENCRLRIELLESMISHSHNEISVWQGEIDELEGWLSP